MKHNLQLAIDRRTLRRRQPRSQPMVMPIAAMNRYERELANEVAKQGIKDAQIVMMKYHQITDGPSETWQRIARLLLSDLGEDAILPSAREAAHAINTSNRLQISLAIGETSLAIVDPKIERAVGIFLRESLKYIRKTRKRIVAEYTAIALEHFRKGKSAGSLQVALMERLSVSESRAKLIARDQTGTFFGTLTEVRHRSLGAESYTWRTSQDERVRSSHADREGQEFRYDSPPSDGNPGQPIACRCTGSPIF